MSAMTNYENRTAHPSDGGTRWVVVKREAADTFPNHAAMVEIVAGRFDASLDAVSGRVSPGDGDVILAVNVSTVEVLPALRVVSSEVTP
jgi:hypothetical protein